MTSEEAKRQLKGLKTSIIANKPVNNIVPTYIEQLAPSKKAGKIKHFKRINQDIKAKFNVHQDLADNTIALLVGGPTGSGTKKGTEWHKKIKAYIDQPSGDHPVGKAVIDALKNRFDGMEFFQSEFPLYGYMVHKGNLKISLWNGQVDAIGWYNGKYVIVDWKLVELLNFWKENNDAYVQHLHQCLVYARLLSLHLGVAELPQILIVPIDHVTGKDIQPGLFKDFPDDCKKALEQYTWHKEEPSQQALTLTRDMVKSAIDKLTKDKKGPVLYNCTIDELQRALGFEE